MEARIKREKMNGEIDEGIKEQICSREIDTFVRPYWHRGLSRMNIPLPIVLRSNYSRRFC